MHGIPKADLKEVIGTIVRNLGSTLAACGDINRNVMAPAAPFEKGGYPAARRLADEISDLLSPEAAEGSYLDLWVDGDLSYRFSPPAAVRRAREIVESPPLAETIAEELQPGRDIQSDEEILKFIQETGQITHHMVGTCRMGQDNMAVVDDRLRVRGIEGLRIADASIMPAIPSGNTNIPSIMIGEKCAAMVLEDDVG